MSKFLNNDDSSADLLSEYLDNRDKLKYKLRALMTKNNNFDFKPVVENVNEMLVTAKLAKEIYQVQRKEKRTWSPSPNPSPGSYAPSYTTQMSPEVIGGLKVPKTKKVMTRRSSTSMN